VAKPCCCSSALPSSVATAVLPTVISSCWPGWGGGDACGERSLMGRNLLRTVMDHRLGLAPLGRAESALGCRLTAPVHRVRPGVWHTPTESAVILMLSAGYCKLPFVRNCVRAIGLIVGAGGGGRVQVWVVNFTGSSSTICFPSKCASTVFMPLTLPLSPHAPKHSVLALWFWNTNSHPIKDSARVHPL